jgi:vacuolar-type H+-ATPase subunit F/Vma7
MAQKKKKIPVRIPVPQKPPKTEEDKTVYNRKKLKQAVRKELGNK